MADAATVQALVDYYTNLLIIQYHNKPRAKATIALLIQNLIASGVMLDVRDGFNIDTAVGAQLDILGKYIGIDRFYVDQDLHDYFSLVTYDDPIDPPERWGFSDYDTFNTFFENGTLNYNSILVTDFSLNDDDYRQLLKLKIIQNNSNHSHKDIDAGIFQIFGTDVRADSTGNMHMIYFVPANMTELIAAAIAKQVLPRPMGVGITIIKETSTFFGFATYAYTPGNNTGFTDYAGYASKLGETLIYGDIGGT